MQRTPHRRENALRKGRKGGSHGGDSVINESLLCEYVTSKGVKKKQGTQSRANVSTHTYARTRHKRARDLLGGGYKDRQQKYTVEVAVKRWVAVS